MFFLTTVSRISIHSDHLRPSLPTVISPIVGRGIEETKGTRRHPQEINAHYMVQKTNYFSVVLFANCFEAPEPKPCLYDAFLFHGEAHPKPLVMFHRKPMGFGSGI